MEQQNYHDPMREITELRNQLSYSKRVGFFFGAGTSKSVGIPDIHALTKEVRKQIAGLEKDNFKKVEKSLKDHTGEAPNIEDVLNQVRLIRQITFEKESKSFDGVNGQDAKQLDIGICNEIYKIVLENEKKADLTHTKKFMTWLNWLSRDFPKELFTTNYDLIIEKSLESLQIPYYDGFVGANEPFFLPESLERNTKYDTPPVSWIRLWKLHGSLGWFWKPTEDKKSYKVVRLGIGAKDLYKSNELVIYPSREKYESSRKQPFIAYFDRLKVFLQDGEGLFIISGYSFSDEHVNSIIFNSLKQNNRLYIIAFFYSDKPLEKLNDEGATFLNCAAIGPKKAIIKGLLGEWRKSKSEALLDAFWDSKQEHLKLGDFRELVRFLLASSGKQEIIEAKIKETNED